MKPLFTIFICMLIGSHVFGQIKKVILSHSQLQPRWVVECDSETEENCTLRVYFPNGRTKATLKIFYHNKKDAFRPNGDGVVYHSNGTIYQDYDHETGILRTYYPTGELEAKMVTPINEGTEYKYSYFKNGQIWEEEVSKRQPGEQNLQFGHSQQRDYFYDNRGYSYTFLKKYHSNGNLAEHSFLEGEGLQAKYVYLFFLPNGKPDLTATYDRKHGQFMRDGRRYQYYPNGQMREIVHYENDKISGERYLWSPKGVLLEKGNYHSGSRHGKYEGWWENGQLKEISHHAGYDKHGPVLRWHHNGQILEQGSYYQGKALGVATVWDTMGNVISQNAGSIEIQHFNAYYNKQYIQEQTYWLDAKGNFANGMRIGSWTFYYYEKGQSRERISGTCAILNYRNGVLHGNAVVYHPNGTILLETSFNNGWMDGDYISKHETGEMVIKGTFANHKKMNLWTRNHYKSHQINTIESFENDVQLETFKEWEIDGFLKKDRIDNPAQRQVEFYDYYKDGMTIKQVRPYGWQHMHYYEYDNLGKLKKTRIYQKNNPKVYEQTEYHPNGQKASIAIIMDNKVEGVYKAWYENGQAKMSVPYENGQRHGTSYAWDEKGVQSVKYFENGIQVIQKTEDDSALTCACNHPPREVDNRFVQSFDNYVQHKTVKQRTDYFTIPEQDYKRLFAKKVQIDNNRLYGELLVANDFYVGMDNGLRLNFTPCRRGENRTHLDISGYYDESANSVSLDITNFDLSIEFPRQLLRLYDIEKQQPLTIDIKKYQNSSVRYEVTRFQYDDDGKMPVVQVEGSNACFQISEIGNTGILFNGNSPELDLMPDAIPNSISEYFKNSDISTSFSVHYSDVEFAPSRKYLRSFMGVYFADGQLHIPYEGVEMVVNARSIFINGKEIHGNIEISTTDYPNVADTKAFLSFLEKKDFKILKSEIVNEHVLYVFWKYVGK